MKNDERNTLYVDFAHVHQQHATLADFIVLEYHFLEDELRTGLRNVMCRHHANYSTDDKDFYVSFYNMSTLLRVRDMKSNCVGKLVR